MQRSLRLILSKTSILSLVKKVPVTYYIDPNQLKPVENVMDIAYGDVTNPSHVSSTIQDSDGSTINPTCVRAPSSTDSAVTLGNFRINLFGSIKSLIARYHI